MSSERADQSLRQQGLRIVRTPAYESEHRFMWLDAGGSIYAVSKLLGHASVDITVARYAAMSNSALFEAANGASKFLMRPKPAAGEEERPEAA